MGIFNFGEVVNFVLLMFELSDIGVEIRLVNIDVFL